MLQFITLYIRMSYCTTIIHEESLSMSKSDLSNQLYELINVEQKQFNPSDVSILYLFTNQYQAVRSFKNFPSQPDIILFIFDKISLKKFSLTFKKILISDESLSSIRERVYVRKRKEEEEKENTQSNTCICMRNISSHATVNTTHYVYIRSTYILFYFRFI